MNKELEDFFQRNNEIKGNMEDIYKLLLTIDQDKENFKSSFESIKKIYNDDTDTKIQTKKLEITNKSYYIKHK